MKQQNIEKRLAKTADYSPDMATKKEVKGYFKMPWN